MSPEDGVCFASSVFLCPAKTLHSSSLLCSKVWPVKQELTIMLGGQESNLSLKEIPLLPLSFFLLPINLSGLQQVLKCCLEITRIHCKFKEFNSIF